MKLQSIDDLRASPRNPRKISGEALAGLKTSLASYGDISGIVWNERTGELVAGHQRVRALKALYGEKLRIEGTELAAPDGGRWTIRVVDWDRETAAAAMVAANNPEITGDFDEQLQELLREIEEADPDAFSGLLLDKLVEEIEKNTAEVQDADELPEEVETRCQPGDLWVLGRHRLLCGDSLRADALARLLDGEKCAMAFTDPPYNVDYKGKAGRIANDNLGGEFGAFLLGAMRNLLAGTTGAVYVCMSGGELDRLQAAFRAAGGHFSTYIIWAKHTFTLGRSDYQRQYEPILYGWKEGAGGKVWNGGRSQSDVWQYNKPAKSDEHPTMKPVEVVMRALKNSSRPGDAVLDLFGGSGTTLVASEMAERRCRMMEMEPKFCDVILARWEKLTGEKAEKCGEGRTL